MERELPTLEDIQTAIDEFERLQQEGLAAMTEEQQRAPFAEHRAIFYTSPEARSYLMSVGGTAVEKLLHEFDDIYTGRIDIFSDDALFIKHPPKNGGESRIEEVWSSRQY